MLKKTLMAAGACALMLPAVAAAQSTYDGLGDTDVTVTGEASGDTYYKAVSLDDLDLTVDRDVRMADNRLRRAAADVCGVGRINGSVVPEQASPCYRDAFSAARVSLNTLVYDVRAG
jgi:UrcA family protein